MKSFYHRPATTTARLFQALADYHDKQDKWGATMGLFFDVVGTMSVRGLPIPAEWNYRESPFGPDISDENVGILSTMPDRALCRLGCYCHRLTCALDRSGVSY